MEACRGHLALRFNGVVTKSFATGYGSAHPGRRRLPGSLVLIVGVIGFLNKLCRF